MRRKEVIEEKKKMTSLSDAAPGILVIEKDVALNQSITQHFILEGYEVDAAFDGRQGGQMARARNYEVIVLNSDLPEDDGPAFCEALRREGYTGAIVLTTEKGTTAAKIAGLDSGADDYIVKPIDLPEFSARIRAILRRGPENKNAIINFGSLTLDTSSYRVTTNGRTVTLTPTEYRLLNFFLRSPNRVFSDEELLSSIWNSQDRNAYELVKAHIKGLRRNLKASGVTNEVVETVRGAGYKLTFR